MSSETEPMEERIVLRFPPNDRHTFAKVSRKQLVNPVFQRAENRLWVYAAGAMSRKSCVEVKGRYASFLMQA